MLETEEEMKECLAVEDTSDGREEGLGVGSVSTSCSSSA